MKNKSVRLLTKTTLVYLVFILVAFIATASFIIVRTNQYIKNDAEQYFTHKEHRVKHNILNDKEKIKNIKWIKQLETIRTNDSTRYPTYTDTSIYISQMDEWLLFRKKTVLLQKDGEYFEVHMHKNISDYEKLKHSIVTVSYTHLTLPTKRIV